MTAKPAEGSGRRAAARRSRAVPLAKRKAPPATSAETGSESELALVCATVGGAGRVGAARLLEPRCSAPSGWVENRRLAMPSASDLAIWRETWSASIDFHMSPASP